MPGSNPVCAARGIPDYLHRLDREPDVAFANGERLFVRFDPSETQFKNIISFKRQSCNRAKYCPGGSEDVLFDSEHGGRHQIYTGVLVITVAEMRQVRAEIEERDKAGRTYTLQPEHKPEQCNYAHTEIVAFCNGREDSDHIKPSSMEKTFTRATCGTLPGCFPSGTSG